MDKKNMFLIPTLKSLDEKVLCMFPNNRNPNLMIRQFHMSLLGMMMRTLESNFGSNQEEIGKK